MDILDRINSNLYNYDEMRDMEIVLEMAMLIDDKTIINEAFSLNTFKTGMDALMKKIGLHTHKSGEGLIAIALKSGKVMSEFVWHALKAAVGNEESKVRVKELANTEIKKEDFVNFLLKLDTVTLHMITGPIHMIDAITGWHIGTHIKSKVEDTLTKAKNAIKNLIDAAKGTEKSVKKKLKSLMNGIVRLFGLEDEKTLIKQI
ncbi:MAG: hypothetical protein KQ78_02146 [Candidatus Izimaplasma bacterium HR2]|nr:MAG: hypothetical protein KQ78_02146 [Candidatus Izimaplasma bacterium HR2]